MTAFLAAFLFSLPLDQVLVPMQSVFSTTSQMDLGDVSFIGSVTDPGARNRAMEKIELLQNGQWQLADEAGFQHELDLENAFCSVLFLDADRMLSDQQFQQIGIPRPTEMEVGTQWKVDYAPAVTYSGCRRTGGTFTSGFPGTGTFVLKSASVVLNVKFRLFDGTAAPRMICVLPGHADAMPTLEELQAILGDGLKCNL